MVFLYLRKQDNGEESSIPPGATYVAPSHPCIPWPTMEVRLTLQKFAEIGSHGFPRVSCLDNKVARQVMAENGRKWQKIEVRLKKTTFAKNGRKWISACFSSWSSR